MEPLTQLLFIATSGVQPLEEATKYLNPEIGVNCAEEALQGAMDIIAETISDDPDTRGWLRGFTYQRGELVTEVKNQEADQRGVYRMYYEHREPVKTVPPHRVLAINRGEKEEILKVKIEVSEETVMENLNRRWISDEIRSRGNTQWAIRLDYRRLLAQARNK